MSDGAQLQRAELRGRLPGTDHADRGNSTIRAQVITVIDTTAPAVTVNQGSDGTIECPTAPSFSAPSFVDGCQGPITPSVTTVTNTVGCTNIITRTWTANDGCSNSTNRAQVNTAIDTT